MCRQTDNSVINRNNKEMCIRKIITSEHFIEPTCAIKLNRRQCWVGTEDSVELGQKTMLSRDRRRCWVGPSTHNSLCRFEICCLQIYGLKNSSILPIFRRPQCWVRVGFGLSYIDNMGWFQVACVTQRFFLDCYSPM